MPVERNREVEDRFRYGDCCPMAAALAARLGGRVEALVVDVPHGRHFVHAWAAAPDGRAVDAAGILDRDTLYEEFLKDSPRKWWNWRIESFETVGQYLQGLEAACGDEDFWIRYKENRFLPLPIKAEAVVEEYLIPRYLADLIAETVPSPRP